jgi:hypothetical protein
VDFPTRLNNNSATTIDNIFIDNHKNKNFSVSPYRNGLSDQDAQIRVIYDTKFHHTATYSYTRWRINERTILEFKISLTYEFWDVFIHDDVNILFNNFLNTYYRLFFHSVPLKNCIVTK